MARLGFEIDSSQAVSASTHLEKMTAASTQAGAAAQRLGVASKGAAVGLQEVAGAGAREAAAMETAALAAQKNAAALREQALASRMASMQSKQLMFQLVDIGQTIPLAFQSPIYALQNVGFQIAQIGQLYAGQGGMKAALSDSIGMVGRFASKFAGVGLVVGAVTAGIAGLTYEINKTSKVHVGFFDVVQAGWQLTAEKIKSVVGPAIGWIGEQVQALWDFIWPIMKNVSNTLIGTFTGAALAIKAVWSDLPNAFMSIMFEVRKAVENATYNIIMSIASSINELMANIDLGLTKLGMKATGMRLNTQALGHALYPQQTNPYEQGKGPLGQASDAFFSGLNHDYVGDAMGALSSRAQAIAAAREQTKGLNDDFKSLAKDGIAKAVDAAQSLSSALGQSIGGALRGLVDKTKSFGDAVKDVLLSLASAAAKQAASMFNSLGGGWGFLGDVISGFFGGFAKGGVFDRAGQVHAFARGGVITKPTVFPFANGTGLMGEAGPEAIMPLRRGPDGRLGVSAARNDNAANQNVRVHVTVGWSRSADGNLRPFVESVSSQTAGTVATAAIGEYDKGMPGRINDVLERHG